MATLQDLKIVFMGTPDFAVASLQTLIEHNASINAVVTTPDKPKGRGLQIFESAVKVFAKQKNLPILQPGKLDDPEFLNVLQNIDADVFIVVAFRILPPSVFTIPPLGTINLHASLLPKYRGAAPIQWAIINGEAETGATTFLIDEKVDTGTILLQRKIKIDEYETSSELHDRLSKIGADLLIETLERIASKSITPQDQKGEITRAPKITKEMAEINWTNSARRLHNFIRGMNPVPGAFTYRKEKLLKIFRAHPVEGESTNEPPGTVCVVDRQKGQLIVATGGGLLEIDELQLQGKKRMTSAEFLRGHQIEISERFGR